MTALTLFSQAAPSGISGSSANQDQVVGLVCEVSSSVPFAAIWHYSPPGAAGLPSGAGLFNYSTHASVAVNSAASWSGAAGSGWVRCSMSSFGVTLSASTLYTAVVYSGTAFSGAWGDYTTGYWTTGGAGASGITNGILSAPNSAGGNIGQQLNSAGGVVYPTSSFSNSFYWLDVEVTVSAPPSTPGLLMAMGM